ncbi:uncharacterized protein LOC113277575 [Papaver somniferum]|uniref:uncharacterized protein LOC113277575 n=1 Tax=Papaver somniferum TaxID=3469 RepID=UPI000E6FBF61|nr:uncharacterized protein LOC113277575 [Papaver somniferum]
MGSSSLLKDTLSVNEKIEQLQVKAAEKGKEKIQTEVDHLLRLSHILLPNARGLYPNRIPEPCDDSLVRIIRVKKIIPRYPSGTCVTVVDDDDLTTPLPSSSNTPAADLEYADLGISSYEYPNASLPFYVHMRCLSSSYRAVGGFLVRKEFVPLNTKI